MQPIEQEQKIPEKKEAPLWAQKKAAIKECIKELQRLQKVEDAQCVRDALMLLKKIDTSNQFEWKHGSESDGDTITIIRNKLHVIQQTSLVDHPYSQDLYHSVETVLLVLCEHWPWNLEFEDGAYTCSISSMPLTPDNRILTLNGIQFDKNTIAGFLKLKPLVNPVSKTPLNQRDIEYIIKQVHEKGIDIDEEDMDGLLCSLLDFSSIDDANAPSWKQGLFIGMGIGLLIGIAAYFILMMIAIAGAVPAPGDPVSIFCHQFIADLYSFIGISLTRNAMDSLFLISLATTMTGTGTFAAASSSRSIPIFFAALIAIPFAPFLLAGSALGALTGGVIDLFKLCFSSNAPPMQVREKNGDNPRWKSLLQATNKLAHELSKNHEPKPTFAPNQAGITQTLAATSPGEEKNDVAPQIQEDKGLVNTRPAVPNSEETRKTRAQFLDKIHPLKVIPDLTTTAQSDPLLAAQHSEKAMCH